MPQANAVGVRLTHILMLAATMAASTVQVFAQTGGQIGGAAAYPRQPIKILVGFAAGGSNDIIARIVAQKLSERLGQPVVVENKTGAGGNIAAEFAARAAPDGYTLFSAPTSTMIHNTAIFANLPYDPQKSFAPITMMATYPFYLSVSTDLPAKSVAELVAYGKANPAKANYGGTTGVFQLISELFKLKTGTPFEHIPFKSSAELVTALITGQTTMSFIDPVPLMPQVRSGKVRILAQTGAMRSPDAPEAPTMAQAGIAGMEAEAFSALVAPAATPPAIIKRLHAEVAAIVKLPDVAERFRQMAANPLGNTPEEFAAHVAHQIPIWKDVVAKAKIPIQ